MNKCKFLGMVLAAAVFGFIAHVGPALADGPKVTKELPDGVEIVDFSYKLEKNKMLKKYKSGADQEKPVLVFNITLKNTSDNPARYQATMLMPKEGKSTGGIMPRSSKKVIGSGEEASETYAALLYDMPESVTLVVNKVK